MFRSVEAGDPARWRGNVARQPLRLRLMPAPSERKGERDFSVILKATPMQRLILPDEVASLIVFLLSPAAEYINGISLEVDGGAKLRSKRATSSMAPSCAKAWSGSSTASPLR